MPDDLNKIGVLIRREIEARILAPFISVLIAELGEEKTHRILQEVVQTVAKESGAQLAKTMGGNSIAHFAESLQFWTKDNALETEVLAQTETTFEFNVRRCRYAEMYRKIGLEKFGRLLSCDRDFALIEGFNPAIKLSRTQTILDGAESCDFRYVWKKPPSP